MLYTSNNLDVQYNDNFEHEAIEFVFKGHFTTEAGKAGAKVWRTEFDKYPAKSFVLIWNCEHMTGFDPSARREWYDCIKDYKPRISKIIMASNRIMIRGAAKVMFSIFGLKSTLVKSFDELEVVAK